MAVSRIGGWLLAANSSSDGTISFVVPAGGIASGSLLVLGVTNADADLDVTSVVDSRSNTYTFDTRQVQAAANSNTFCAAWTIVGTALQAADTITFTWNSTGFNEFTGVAEWFSGVDATPLIGSNAYAQDIAFPQSQPNIGSFDADYTEELDVCVYSLCDAPLTVTATSGWSTQGKDEDTSSPQTTLLQYRISANEAGLATGITTSADTYWGGLRLRFKGNGATQVVPEISFDAATESVRTATTDPWTFSHTGRADASGGVQGVVVTVVHGTSSTDHVVGVTYGGVSLTRASPDGVGIADMTATDTATEPGRADIWWIGSGLSGKGGTQTVSVDLSSATTDDIQIVAMTLYTDSGANVTIVDSDRVQENAANPSVTLTYGGRYAISIGALYGGGAAPSSFTPNGNCTEVASEDLGAFYAFVLRQTTPGTSDFAIGGTASSDDVAYVAAAFAKVAGSTSTKTGFGKSGADGHGADVMVDTETGRGIVGLVGAGPSASLTQETGFATGGLVGSGQSASLTQETGFGVVGLGGGR